MDNISLRIIFFIVGGKSRGLGHLERSTILASEFKKILGDVELLFVFSSESVLEERLELENIPYKTYPPAFSVSEHLTFLKKLLGNFSPSLIVSDQGDTSKEIMHLFHSSKALIVDFEDLGDGGYSSHILVDANREKRELKNQRTPVSPVEKYRQVYQTEQNQLFGREYVLLKPCFVEWRKKSGIPPLKPKKVLVSMGGADERGASVKVVKALNGRLEGIKIIVIIGAAFSHQKQLKKALEESGNAWEIQSKVSNMAKYMAEADVAIVSGGITLYETICMGLPSITICTAAHQLPIATRLEKHGVTVCMEMEDQVSEKDIGDSFLLLARDWQKRISMSQKGKVMIDGRGLYRIVDAAVSELNFDT